MRKLTILLLACLFCVSSNQASVAVKMGRVSNGMLGTLVEIAVTLENPEPVMELGGLDLMFIHHSGLSFQHASIGPLLSACDWEYFTYYAPSNERVHLVTMADINNGPYHPSCYADTSGILAWLKFMVYPDSSNIGEFLPIRWAWYDCGDNSISSVEGDSLFISENVYDYDGYTYSPITCDSAFPNTCGAPEECLQGGSVAPVRAVDFYNGGVYIYVPDVEPPTAICPDDMIVDSDPGKCGARVTFDATVNDNMPCASISCTPSSGYCFEVGLTTVTCVAVDAAGNTDTCNFTIEVRDVGYPQVNCPYQMIVENDPGQCGAVVTIEVDASDNCPGVVVTTYPPSGSFFEVGTTDVVVIATDGPGNYDGCFIHLTVNDTEPPEIVPPADTVVDCQPGECGAVVEFDLQVNDNCPGVTVISEPVSGSTFDVGTTWVKIMAFDAAGNRDSASFYVTVNDIEPPLALCPDDITVFNDPGEEGALVEFEVSAQDNCSGVVTVAEPPSGSFFSLGGTSVRVVATDGAGLTDTCYFNVHVNLRDTDGDGRVDLDDNCPEFFNPDQEDADADGIGDSCDVCTDTDEDGFGDPGYPATTCEIDNCPGVFNPDQEDADADGIGDSCDVCTDLDDDGFGDPGYPVNTCDMDNCPEDYNPDQIDSDYDGIGDSCCCVGLTGNVDCDPGSSVDIGDVTVMINHLFISLDPLCCFQEANVDLTGIVDMGDLTKLLDHLFISLAPLPACP